MMFGKSRPDDVWRVYVSLLRKRYNEILQRIRECKHIDQTKWESIRDRVIEISRCKMGKPSNPDIYEAHMTQINNFNPTAFFKNPNINLNDPNKNIIGLAHLQLDIYPVAEETSTTDVGEETSTSNVETLVIPDAHDPLMSHIQMVTITTDSVQITLSSTGQSYDNIQQMTGHYTKLDSQYNGSNVYKRGSYFLHKRKEDGFTSYWVISQYMDIKRWKKREHALSYYDPKMNALEKVNLYTDAKQPYSIIPPPSGRWNIWDNDTFKPVNLTITYPLLNINGKPYAVNHIHGKQLTIDTDRKDQQLLITNPHDKDIKAIVEKQWTLDRAADHVQDPLLNDEDTIQVDDTSANQTVTGKIKITKNQYLQFVTDKPKE